MTGMQLPLVPGLDPAPMARDELERVYTPDSLAMAAVRQLDDGTHNPPLRVVEGHVGGGAWVRACRRVWGTRPSFLLIDKDPDCNGLAVADARRLVADFASREAMEAVADFDPDLVIGNPPFSEARDQLEELWAWGISCRIAWVLPIDLWSNQQWAQLLRRFPPAVVRPITRRVWPCVRGVAVWEWWRGRRTTQVEPLVWGVA